MSVTTVPHWLQGASDVFAAAAAEALPSAGAQAGVELVNLATAFACRAAWDDLAERALEPNIFLESGFLLPAALHIAVSRRPKFLLVWESEGRGAARRLIGLCPIQLPSLARAGAATVWLSKQSCMGAPLLDKARAKEALTAMLDYFARGAGKAAGLAFPKVPQAGKTAALIRETAKASGRRLELSGGFSRAALSSGPAAAQAMAGHQSARDRKELRRKRRRLEDGGEVSFVSVTSPAAVRAAVEEFLTLEANGWKGERHTAFLSSPGQSAFLRSLTRDLARQGKCRIDTLTRAGKPAAMGIVLTSGGQATFWKTAYDESLASLSPGVQLCREISARQLADGETAQTDSCAIADHPMIDAIWPERIAIADMLLASAPGARAGFAIAHARAGVAGRLRNVARKAYYRLRGRKIS